MLSNTLIDTLAAAIVAADTEITLTTNFTDVETEIASDAQVYLRLVDNTTGDSEIVIAYASTGAALTVLRGAGGSTARDWPVGTLVKLVQVVNQSESDGTGVCGNTTDCDDPAYEIVQSILLSDSQLQRLCSAIAADQDCIRAIAAAIGADTGAAGGQGADATSSIWGGIVATHLAWDGTTLDVDFDNDGDPTT